MTCIFSHCLVILQSPPWVKLLRDKTAGIPLLFAPAMSRNYGSISSSEDCRALYSRNSGLEINDSRGSESPPLRAQSTRRALAIGLLSGAFLLFLAGYLATSTVVANWNSPLDNTISSDAKTADIVTPQPATPSAVLSLPTQVHVALADLKRTSGSSPGVTVSWATTFKTSTSRVRFGSTPADLTRVVRGDIPSEQYQFCAYTSPWFHHVEIPSSVLKPSTTYYCASVARGVPKVTADQVADELTLSLACLNDACVDAECADQCGDDESGWSAVALFRTPVAVGGRTPITVGVIGDLGCVHFRSVAFVHSLKLTWKGLVLTFSHVCTLADKPSTRSRLYATSRTAPI